MRWWFLRYLLGVLLVLGGVGGYAYWRVNRFLESPLSDDTGLAQVKIPRGANFREVVALLDEAGLVRDPLVFQWWGRFEGVGSNIKAGAYAIDRTWTPKQLMEKLQTGGLVPQVLVTIPEGYNRWQIADLLSKEGLVDRAKFLAKVEAQGLEGRLFPDTYWIKQTASLEEVVKQLTGRFDQVFDEVVKGAPEEPQLRTDPEAKRRLLIMASLVEKEAKTQRDRLLVSRVFHNRVAKGMKLETDPTCVYGPDTYQEVPHPRFCKNPDNAYSTYMIPGLPPGPIANPGRAALDAALRPATDGNAARLLYFVARRDGTGEHHFSETYAEHERAVERYLKGGSP